ncbi:MAG: hypothetical protein WC971_09055 [Coriobacteriia bacterium]
MDRIPTEQEQGAGRLRVVLVAILLLLTALLAVLGFFFVRVLHPAGAPTRRVLASGGISWIRSMYGFGPAADEQLLDPTSVAFAPNGDVYVSDPQRSRVMRFAAGGAFKNLVHTGMGGRGQGMLGRPEGMDTDAAGNLYIADSGNDKIVVFNNAGRFVREWAVQAPRGLEVEGNNVYVLAPGAVQVFDLQGQPQGRFGRRGRGPGMIDAYQGIETDGKTIYIADSLNRRVEAFDSTGKLLWTSPGIGPDGAPNAGNEDMFDLPQDITFDGKGRLVVIDAFKFQMILLDPKTGKLINDYGDYGTDDGTFFYPTGIAYDRARDWFAVADTRNLRVQLVRFPGSGGSGASAFRRAIYSPYRYCSVPLLLLLIAVIVAVMSRRSMARRAAYEEQYA